MSTEASDLAQTFLTMLLSVPLGRKKNHPRELLIERLRPAVGRILDACLKEPLDRQAVESSLALEFARCPSLAGELWIAAEQSDTSDWPRPFWLVLRDELKQISCRRSPRPPIPVDNKADLYNAVATGELVGLAFSGGGIRSATFNLGVLQGLAEFGFLPRVDYLSTVSGGGYIGAWFAAWLHRSGLDPASVQQRLSPESARNPDATSQKPVRFLRQFSNYLTPALGLFSFDPWTMAAVYLRNVILNQLTLLAGFGALLILPRLIGALVEFAAIAPAWLEVIETGAAAVLMVVAVSLIAKYLNVVTSPTERSGPPEPANVPLIHRVCTCLFTAVWIVSQLFWTHTSNAFLQSLTDPLFALPSLLFFTVLSLIVSLRGGFKVCFFDRLRKTTKTQFGFLLLLVTSLTVIAGTLLLRGYVILMQFFHAQGDSGVWHATVWGAPALLAVLGLTAIMQVGLMGVDFPDSGREWLSRFRAITNVYTFFWLALFCASVYGPWLIAKTGVWVAGLGTVWIGTTITAVLAGKSRGSGQSKEGAPTVSIMDRVAKIGPPVFLVGFVLLVSFGLNLVLAHPVLNGDYSFASLLSRHWNVLNFPLSSVRALWDGGDWFIAAPVTLLILLAGAAAVLAWRVDINEFSMHHFYKNRLVRCYLGASNPDRRPDAFTGFDEKDDMRMADLQMCPAPGAYRGPYHIVNATLNLSSGDQLAWQERQAASFVFTPCYSGFNLQIDSDHPVDLPTGNKLRPCAYRKTHRYAYAGGIRLGTALSISGAAADPNQGYNTSPAVAFLMTVFDVRLGWWLGNPRRDNESKLSSPTFGLAAIIGELFGMTDDRTSFVSLSDGGHFDNMAIYELVRRRCKFIVLCDAEQDGAYTFGGLGMAIRKCRIDFGAEIDIDPKRIVPLTATGRSDSHCAVGTITYADREKGTLVYIKSSLTGDEPEDVLQYAAGKPAFPQESTADQWFTESQFESYRKLGYHAATSAFVPAGKWIKWQAATTATGDLFRALTNYWYPLNPSLREHATTHTKTLNDLFDKIRENDALQDLGTRLFPGAGFIPKPGDPAAEYFFCMTLIQLVEDIYFDFQLDRNQWHDDPRIGGWMTIFRTWKKTPQMGATWQAGSQTFRADFQQFWENL